MVRHLYKTLLISVTCSSLLMSNTSFADSSTTTTKREEGVVKKTETYKFEKIKDRDMMASLTMLSTGLIASRFLYKYRPLSDTDVMIAAAGGIAFMAGEVMSNIDFKKTMDEKTAEITKRSDGKKDQAQIDLLDDLKKSYEKAKKTSQTKKMLQLTAAAAFAGAAAISTKKMIEEYMLMTACEKAIAVGIKNNTICPEATETAGAAAAPCSQCVIKLGLLQNHLVKMNNIRDWPTPTKLEDKAVKSLKAEAEKLIDSACIGSSEPLSSPAVAKTAVSQTCTLALQRQGFNEIFTDNPKVASYNQQINKILFGDNLPVISDGNAKQSLENPFVLMIEKSLNMIIPRADASWIPLISLGLGSAATTGTFMWLSAGQAVAVDMYMYVPRNRATAFAGLAGLSYAASKSTDHVMEDIDKNIKKIDEMLSELNKLSRGVQAANVVQRQIKLPSFHTTDSEAILLSQDAKVKTNCATSMGTSNCTSLSNLVRTMPDFSGLPASFQTIASQSAGIGDGLSGTNSVSGATLTEAGSLAGKQNAIANILTKTQNKLNEELVKSGKPKIDFEKEQNAFLNKVNDAGEKALRSRGVSPGNFLASIGRAPIDSSVNLPKKYQFPTKAAVAPAVGSSSTKGKELDLEFAEEPEMVAMSDDVGDKPEKFDIGSNDIVTNDGASIFEIISNRYIKSGYPKLLDEIPANK